MVDSESSLRLRLLRFPLIVGVVFIHAYGTTVDMASGRIGVGEVAPGAEFLRNLISQGIARIAVPLFFLTAGYLFYSGNEWSHHAYLAKLRRRLRTLLVPFLFWNVATLLLFALGQTIPATQAFFSRKHSAVAGFGVYDYANAIFGIDRYPIAYQFWFIRDLLLVLLLLPLLGRPGPMMASVWLTIVTTCWFADVWPLYAPSAEAVLFFSAGNLLAQTGKSLFALDRFGPFAVTLYIPMVVLDALSDGGSLNPYLHKLAILPGLLAAMYATRHIAGARRLRATLIRLGGASFFVFAIHEPLLTASRKIAYACLHPDSSALVLLLYCVVPLTVIALAVAIHRVAASVAPKFTDFITGGR